MYYAHFGLTEAPFRITPNTEVFFAGGNRGPILDALIYAISQGEGIVKVTGEVGTGKTMLCNMLQSRLPPEVETVYLAHPSVSPEEILHAIAFELQLNVPRDAGRMEVMQSLYTYLLERHAQKKQVVIFIEESQNMPIPTLEEVRLLSNLETGKHKLLQIVLFGQPELDENLRQPNIRQLRERITHSFALPPLAPQEVGEYLMFRLRAVGYRGPDLFSAGVIKRIAQASAGLTRRVNLIADKALLAAFSDNTHTVQAKHVAAAIRDSEFARDGVTGGKAIPTWAIAVVVGCLVLAALAYFGWSQLNRTAAAPSTPQVLPASTARPEITPSDSAPRAANAGAPADAAGVPSATGAPPASANDEAVKAAIAVAHAAATLPGTPAAAKPDVGDAVASLQQATQAITSGNPAPASQPTEIKGDILESRLRAGDDWLRAAPGQTLTIQLLGTENSPQLKEHLSTIAKSIEINNIFVYRTVARQKPFLTVLYGSFGSREAAQDALDRLPPSLKANKPYLRTVQGVRDEMSRLNAGR